MNSTPRFRAASISSITSFMRPKFFCAGDLDVKDVHRHARALADRDRLLDAFAQLLAVVAQVRGVESAGGAGGLDSATSSSIFA